MRNTLTKSKILAASLMTAALFLSGCTVSASSANVGASAASDQAGLPVAVDGAKARSMVHDSLKGKKVAYIPMSLQFDLTAMWGQQFKSLFGSLGAEYSESDPANNVDTQIRMIDPLQAAARVHVLVLDHFSQLAHRRAGDRGVQHFRGRRFQIRFGY